MIVTHAHRDHIGCVPHFRKAVVHIQRDEAAVGAKYLKGLSVDLFDADRAVADVIEVKKIAGHSIGSSIVIILTGAFIRRSNIKYNVVVFPDFLFPVSTIS